MSLLLESDHILPKTLGAERIKVIQGHKQGCLAAKRDPNPDDYHPDFNHECSTQIFKVSRKSPDQTS